MIISLVELQLVIIFQVWIFVLMIISLVELVDL